MMRRNREFIERFIMMIFCSFIFQTSLAQYYCSPKGSMSNNGLSPSNPWADLETVVSLKKFSGGEVVYLMSGNHGFPIIKARNNIDVTITKAGGQNPVIDHIKFDGASHWVLADLKISTNGANTPLPNRMNHPVSPRFENSLIQISGNSTFLTFTNCNISSIDNSASWTLDNWNNKTWNGLMALNGNKITVDNCIFKNVNFGVEIGASNFILKNSVIQNFMGDGIRPKADHILIENNVVKDCYKTNGNHDDGIQYHQSAADVVIRGNKILNVTDYSRKFIGSMQGIYGLNPNAILTDFVIENNLICVDQFNAICLGRVVVNCRIINNTIIQRPDFNPATNIRNPRIWVINNDSSGGGPNCIIRNNIIHNGKEPIKLEGVNTNWSIDHNIHGISFPDGYNNLFKSFTKNLIDCHLKSTATSVIDKGNNKDAPVIDLDGNLRTGIVDIGCYEYNSTE